MVDILLDFPIKAPMDRVFRAVSTPQGLDTWWTKRSAGRPHEGEEYELSFGPDHQHADSDWIHTRVGLRLERRGAVTWVRFHHTGWPSASEHFRISCNCWAMYLRVLRRSLEHGESVPYEGRLDV
jgi:hypothetical protein